jgi:hypothetical protein
MIRRFLRLIGELLRELSDESAYARHLAAHGAAHSAEEWRRFSDGRWEAKSRRGRCC